MNHSAIFDSLYGEIDFEKDISRLIYAPVIQRLRHVRLSNIDSLAMPGISGGARYEHVLGVCYLASQTAMAHRLNKEDRIAFIGAALLHDWAITAFGHLVEEGLAYAGISFNHENKLEDLVRGESSHGEVGGIDRQIFCGRESGLGKWASSIVKESDSDQFWDVLMGAIRGAGKFGKAVSGRIDLDNIDGVCRIAYHIGLSFDKSLPLELAKNLLGVNASGEPIFRTDAVTLIEDWLRLRTEVYQRLMTSQPDFSAKVMLLYCTYQACLSGDIKAQDWNLVDHEFIALLTKSKSSQCRKTVARWLVGEFWPTSELIWLTGSRPDYSSLALFSQELSQILGRECFAYGIKDKRVRQCEVVLESGTRVILGRNSDKWLFGVGSSRQKNFTVAEMEKIRSVVSEKYNCTQTTSSLEMEKDLSGTGDLFGSA